MTDGAAPSEAPAPQTGAEAIAAPPAPEQAPAAAPPADPPKAAAPPTDAPWWAKLEDPELRGVAESRQWKSPEEAVRSYRNLEKLKGVPEDQLVRLPSDLDDAEALAPVFDRLGRPKAADDYEVDLGDESAAIKKLFHDAGLTKAQAKKLAAAYGDHLDQLGAKTTEELTQKAQAEFHELRAEWGSTYESRMGDVRRAHAKLGLSTDELNTLEHTLGTKRVFEVLHKVGTAFGGEPGSPGDAPGGPGSFGMSPDAARAEIARLKGDKDFAARLYQRGDAKAKAEWERLHRLAYPS